jgi:two-component system chemotaxis sensor kinase CheA
MINDQEIVNLFCDETLDLLNRWERLCLDLLTNHSEGVLQELFRIAHNIKGGSRAVGLADFGNYIHKIEDSINLLKEGKLVVSPSIQKALLGCHGVLIVWLKKLQSADFDSPDCQASLDRLEECHLEKSISPSEPARVVLGSSSTEKVSSRSKSLPTANETIRISALKLDQILQLIGELSIQQTILWHGRNEVSPTNQIQHKSLQLSQKLVRDLYDRALGLRMQPLSNLFQRLERNIQDLSGALDKKVNVFISGADVELDKSIIEKIMDPLTHIIRNAIDHGIETSEQRMALGKLDPGRIEIVARQETFGVLITISDDGRGLDSLKIRNKAVEKGLLDSSTQLNEKDCFQLIFLPGFSTAEKLTDVSGRGVGMDVVRRSLEEISGKIEIESQINLGTKFSIVLPTSVNIIEGMLVSLSSQTYVIPINHVDEVIDVENEKEKVIHNSSILPLVELERLLSHSSKSLDRGRDSSIKSVVLCTFKSVRVGFLVDRILGQQQVVIRPLEENISGCRGILGGTILGTGEPGLIINLPELAESFIQGTQFDEVV